MKLITFSDGHKELERKIVTPGGVKRTITNFCKNWDCGVVKMDATRGHLRDNLGRIIFVDIVTYSKRYHG